MTALIVTEECGAETIAVTITKKCNIYFPAHISLVIFSCWYYPQPAYPPQKNNTSQNELTTFSGLRLLISFISSALSQYNVRQTRNKFAAPAVSFKRIWHNISNVYFILFAMNDTNVCHGGRSKRVSKTALTGLKLLLPLSHSSLLFSGKTTVWLLQMNWQFPYFRIHPQTMRGSWENLPRGYSGFQVTGMIEGIFWRDWNFWFLANIFRGWHYLSRVYCAYSKQSEHSW